MANDTCVTLVVQEVGLLEHTKVKCLPLCTLVKL